MKTKLATLLETQIGFYNPKIIKLIIDDPTLGVGHHIDYHGAASSIKLTDIIEEYGDFDINVTSIEYENSYHEKDVLYIGGWFISPFAIEDVIRKFIKDYGSFGLLCISVYEYNKDAENKERIIGKYFLNESKQPSTFDNFQIDGVVKDICNREFNAIYGDHNVKTTHIYITPDKKNIKNSAILLQIVIEESNSEEEFEDDIFI